jgi:hypothetical protein
MTQMKDSQIIITEEAAEMVSIMYQQNTRPKPKMTVATHVGQGQVRLHAVEVNRVSKPNRIQVLARFNFKSTGITEADCIEWLNLGNGHWRIEQRSGTFKGTRERGHSSVAWYGRSTKYHRSDPTIDISKALRMKKGQTVIPEEVTTGPGFLEFKI